MVSFVSVKLSQNQNRVGTHWMLKVTIYYASTDDIRQSLIDITKSISFLEG